MGGLQANLNSHLDLRMFLDYNALIDVKMTGAKFTWSNRHIGVENIQVRLDKDLTSASWFLDFSCSLSSITRCGSNHFPISFLANRLGDKKCFPFRFEAIWLRDLRFMDCIKKWWKVNIDSIVIFKVAKKMTFVKRNLKKWNRESFGHIFESKSYVIQRLDGIQETIQERGLSEDLQL